MPVVSNVFSRQAGVQSALKEFWRMTIPAYRKEQALFFHYLPWTNLRKARYSWKESTPFPRLWNYGTKRTIQTFQDRYIDVAIYPYDLNISWNKFDAEDDQLGTQDMKTSVQQAVERFAGFPVHMMVEYLNGVASLNPALLNAYDGVPLFSAVDGDGNARGGVTGGNIITGTGTTPAAILNDICVAQQRFVSIQDPTAGKPIYTEDDVPYSKMTIVYPKELNQQMLQVSTQEFILGTVGQTAPESNYLKGTFKTINQNLLTDVNDYYVVLENSYYKPFAFRAPETINSVLADQQNSDSVRMTNEEYIVNDIRLGMTPLCWFSIMKITNT